ncbi:putative enzyme related to lactoylglutathione lyase [Arthrobacter pigmenti]|uniref:Putative enzyme related to lactoylglutathione lyase n=1 Tax=Arthrobacter pigmenti TaxID=271432 RepID=A0A846RJZ9_9MICC|nr:VOC family protein [Arthrobacter pigmenti]NJC23563.1 putative enzyme related to lactoylglutathione lyase [Arthrobacter pigmenti]
MTTLQGLTTMVLTADDVDAAADWYATALGIDPYFRRPEEGPAAYVEFRLGPDEDELGIMDRSYAPSGSSGTGTSITHWQVNDIEAAVADLLARGATTHTAITERGGGFTTASVVDPFGNVLGLMHSPHWTGKH